MSDTVKIQVIIEEETAYGTFRDAIYYKDMAEYESKKLDGSHESEKATRVANYVSAIENPQIQKEPSKAELEAMKLEIISQAEAQVAELDDKISGNGK